MGSFDYSTLGVSKAFAAASKRRADRLRKLDGEAGGKLVEMGRLLAEQSDAFASLSDKYNLRGSETWSSWVRAELGWQRHYANRLIQVHRAWGDRPAELHKIIGCERMKITSAYSHGEAREEIVRRVERTGVPPSLNEVRRMIGHRSRMHVTAGSGAVVIDRRVAEIVRQVFLPRNPDNMRTMSSEIVEAARAFIRAVEGVMDEAA